jgi:chromate transporter
VKLYFLLFIEFFKIGLFSVGGGYATIPFLYQIMDHYGWYTSQQLSNMIAISMLTPGPVGVNMATFAGFHTSGVIAAILATLSLILPTYIIVIIVSRLLQEFKENFYVKSSLEILKPTGCGLLTVIGIRFFHDNITNIWSFLIFITLFILSFKFKKNPLYYMLIAGIMGVIMHYFKIINI